jgi:hypothetical protein
MKAVIYLMDTWPGGPQWRVWNRQIVSSYHADQIATDLTDPFGGYLYKASMVVEAGAAETTCLILNRALGVEDWEVATRIE